MIQENEYLRIAVITGPHALHGRLKILVVSDNISRFQKGAEVIVKEEKGFVPYKIKECSPVKGKIFLLYLDGVSDRNKAEDLQGAEIFITREEAEKTRDEILEDEEFYYYDLMGCSVYLEGSLFGEVADIIEAGAGEVIVIADTEGKKHMIPFIESMVDTSRIKDQRIDISPVEGLLDL